MSYEELQEMYEDSVITNGREFWKYYIIENLLCMYENRDFSISTITEDKIEKMIDNILANENLFTEIDYAVIKAIEEEK